MDRRRYLMMQNDKPKIITDGLIFHLDGKNKGADIDNGYWTDLVQGIKFKLEDCIINSDNVEFNGKTSYGWNNTDLDKMNFPYATHTLECTFYVDNPISNYVILMLNRSDNVTLGNILWGGHLELIPHTRGKVNSSFSICPKNNYTMSSRESFLLTNLHVSSNGVGGGWYVKNSNYVSIGTRLNADKTLNFPLNGKIYSIRIYNRQLSEEEMLYNQQCDIDNYFGGTLE